MSALSPPLDTADPPAPVGVSRRITAAVVGNALEFYDFTSFTFFAVQIGRTFFPAHDAFGSLMLSLATFGVGFVGRPIGGLLIGAYADRVGRRPAMLFSFTLMGVAVLALALTPSYRAIGVAAPVLVVLARVAQGFALGGEVGPSTAYLMEAATPGRRGLFVSLQYATQNVANLAGGAVGLALTQLLSPAALQGWGWRVAFLIGAVLLPLGVVLRRGLPETLPPERAAAAGGRLALVLAHRRIVALGLGLIASGTISTYVLLFMTTYAVTSLHMGQGVAFGAGVAVGAASVVGNIAGGAWSDRIGRRPVMIWPRVVLLAAIYPAFLLMVRRHDALVLLGGAGLLAGLFGLTQAAALTAITESLPIAVRSVTLATVYASAVAVFGGTTQLVVAWLIHATGNPLAPAWYMLVATAVGLGAALLVRETVGVVDHGGAGP